MSLTKIGLTTKKTPADRIREGRTYNPFIRLFTTYELGKCTFGVSQKELSDIESYIHDRSNFGARIKHLESGIDSEWFQIHPEDAESIVDWIIAKRGFSVDNLKLYTSYEGPHNYANIHVPRMKKIKKIYRPDPIKFSYKAEDSGIPYKYYRPYLEYLIAYHSRPPEGKVYL